MGTIRIMTEYGEVEGFQQGEVMTFLGVPFAAPPVGRLRLRSPEKPEAWTGVLDCTKPAPMPMQLLPPHHPLNSHPMGEDCLCLNIWAPVNMTEKCAVHVWFYGGALQGGCADSPDLDGSAYARDGVVAVTASYRVGVLGFLCHPDMSKEDPEGLCGNFGHRDQIAALRWIQENIEAFGGDPARVTISGQSAGSGSCCTLMNAPAARGLFHRVICHSGDIFQPERDVPLTEAQGWGEALLESFGCRTLDEFREIPAEELYKDGDPMMKRVGKLCACVIDPAFLPGSQGELTLKNRCMQVPVIIGTNRDEGSRWRAEEYIPAVTGRLGLPEDLYADRGDLNAQAGALAVDYWYARHLAWAKIRAEYYQLPTWQYVFARRLGPMGAFHGAEIPYTFGNLDRMQGFGHPLDYTVEDTALSKLMHAYWVNFIKNGDPNGEGLPAWPGKEAGGHMQFDLQSAMHDDVVDPRSVPVLEA
ncbi:MAG: carboxylesterase family protein, partial [Lachnospiraceae bacterium]|nr:carboxylesterase family protein [Lachnospiraceae bacterium]